MSSNLPPLPDLFADTSFTPEVQNAIYADLTYLFQEFPGLRALRYPGPPNSPPRVLIQGQIQVSVSQNKPYLMPLSMSLPTAFPDVPPVAQIPAIPGQTIVPSQFIRADGVLLLAAFFQWRPRVSTLRQFVRAIAETVSKTPPFATLGTPQKGRGSFRQTRVPIALLQQDAERLVADANTSIDNAFKKKIESEEPEKYLKTAQDLEEMFGKCIGAMNEKLRSIRDVPVTLEPAVERDIELKAKVEAYGEAQAGLANSYGRRELSFDQYMKATRELARMHFQNVLFDVLQN
jgi:hypothetical protein